MNRNTAALDTTDFLSKAFWFIARPGNLLAIILVLAAITAWIRPRNSGRFTLTILAAALVLVTLLPVHSWVARPLEERFPRPAQLPGTIDGIVVLGGFFQYRIAAERGVLAVSETAERIMVPAELALQYPEARILITGQSENHARLRDWLTNLGLGKERIEFEAAAGNTYENALLSYGKINPEPRHTWLLVTTAQHMPRAVGVFRKVGWSVLPYPVDYKTAETSFLDGWPDVAGNLVSLGDSLKEWVGLVAYYMMDRTDELFPAPTG